MRTLLWNGVYPRARFNPSDVRSFQEDIHQKVPAWCADWRLRLDRLLAGDAWLERFLECVYLAARSRSTRKSLDLQHSARRRGIAAWPDDLLCSRRELGVVLNVPRHGAVASGHAYEHDAEADARREKKLRRSSLDWQFRLLC